MFVDTPRYAKCIEASKRVRWEIEDDVIRGRSFDFGKHFMPEGLSLLSRLAFLLPSEQRLLSQIQGRTYANMFGLIERFIGTKMLEVSRDHWIGEQVALEALVRFTYGEPKRQALSRRIEQMIAVGMPDGYEFAPHPDDVARQVLAASTWAVLALTCHIERFTQVHYAESLAAHGHLSELYEDVFLYQRNEVSQHAILDELEWQREDARLTPSKRDDAVDDLIGLMGSLHSILQTQAAADASYFQRVCGRSLNSDEAQHVALVLLDAYRWQYVQSGLEDAHFQKVLGSMLSLEQGRRVQATLAMLLA